MKLEGKILGYNKKILLVSSTLLFVSGVFFYAGAKYEKHKLRALGLLVEKNQNELSFKGFLVAKDNNTFTIRLDDGTEKSFPMEESTTFGPRGKGIPEDFFIGHLLVISGENKPDGAFTVQNIRKSRKSPKINLPQENTNAKTADFENTPIEQ